MLSARQLISLCKRVLTEFSRNRGLLLAGALAFYMLLSSVPAVILLLLGASFVIDMNSVLAWLSQGSIPVPIEVDTIVVQAQTFIEKRQAVSIVLLAVLLISSGLAFRTLREALLVFLGSRTQQSITRRFMARLWPFLCVPALGLAFGAWLMLGSAIEAVALRLGDHAWAEQLLTYAAGPWQYFGGMLGLFLFTATLFQLLPDERPQLTHSLIGAGVATVLWAVLQQLLVWYFSSLSFIGVIYGSLATVIAVLVTFEGLAAIMLLGAQVVAVLEHPSGERDLSVAT